MKCKYVVNYYLNFEIIGNSTMNKHKMVRVSPQVHQQLEILWYRINNEDSNYLNRLELNTPRSAVIGLALNTLQAHLDSGKGILDVPPFSLAKVKTVIEY